MILGKYLDDKASGLADIRYLHHPELFDWAGTVHDWRNHVPEDIRVIWNMLSRNEKLLIAIISNVAADKEEWD